MNLKLKVHEPERKAKGPGLPLKLACLAAMALTFPWWGPLMLGMFAWDKFNGDV